MQWTIFGCCIYNNSHICSWDPYRVWRVDMHQPVLNLHCWSWRIRWKERGSQSQGERSHDLRTQSHDHHSLSRHFQPPTVLRMPLVSTRPSPLKQRSIDSVVTSTHCTLTRNSQHLEVCVHRVTSWLNVMTNCLWLELVNVIVCLSVVDVTALHNLHTISFNSSR